MGERSSDPRPRSVPRPGFRLWFALAAFVAGGVLPLLWGAHGMVKALGIAVATGLAVGCVFFVGWFVRHGDWGPE